MSITPEMRAVMNEVMDDFKAGKLEPDPVPWWWETRREHELTPDYLGRVLNGLGLQEAEEMAAQARMGKYDDWHDDDGLGHVRLVAELRTLGKRRPDARGALDAIENAVKLGEFDSTKAEGDRWAASKVGRETMAALTPEVRAQADAVFEAIERKRKTGRNDPCPCGSGLKYKRCHGAPPQRAGSS